MDSLLILIIIFILLGIILLISKVKKLSIDEFVYNLLWLLLVSTLIFALYSTNRDLREKSKGKCPEYEQVTETFYKRK